MKGQGIKVGAMPASVALDLEKYYGMKQFPFVKREGKDKFAVFVHSKPFGGGGRKLTDTERESRVKARRAIREKVVAERSLARQALLRAKLNAKHNLTVKAVEEYEEAKKSYRKVMGKA